jgi:hypothetical protein
VGFRGEFQRLMGSAEGAALVDGAEAVVRQRNLTKRDGGFSKLRIARSALRPTKTLRSLAESTVDEVRAHRTNAVDGE